MHIAQVRVGPTILHKTSHFTSSRRRKFPPTHIVHPSIYVHQYDDIHRYKLIYVLARRICHGEGFAKEDRKYDVYVLGVRETTMMRLWSTDAFYGM